MAGYSGVPLAKKLGIKEGSRIFAVAAPKHYRELLAPLPKGAGVVSQLTDETDIVHIFSTRRSHLTKAIRFALGKLKQTGAIWVSWPKRSANVPTDITEDTVREIALPLQLVDIKVCAVDDTWSGLKLVVRRENRSKKQGQVA